MESPARVIDPRQVAFDIDGVIADTMQLFVDIAREDFGISHLRTEDMTDYHLDTCLDLDPGIIETILNRIIEGNYATRLAPMQDAGRVLRRVGQYGPIHLVTARPKPGPMESWLAELLPPERFEVVLEATGSFKAKAEVLKSHNIRFFVEDRLETCFLLKENNITPVLYIQPWNREPHPFLEVAGWRQLERLFDFD